VYVCAEVSQETVARGQSACERKREQCRNEKRCKEAAKERQRDGRGRVRGETTKSSIQQGCRIEGEPNKESRWAEARRRGGSSEVARGSRMDARKLFFIRIDRVFVTAANNAYASRRVLLLIKTSVASIHYWGERGYL
jgi:hypothetical protein